jgi:RNA polymerase sigma-70 factor (ECF subfamily)
LRCCSVISAYCITCLHHQSLIGSAARGCLRLEQACVPLALPATRWASSETKEGGSIVADRPQPVAPSTGFRRDTAIDDSPNGLRQTQLAVDRAKVGDQEALRLLYVSYSNNIYGYVRSIVRDDYEAEDITQHVFAKLMTHLDRYNERGAPFFAWLIRLAHNVAIDHLRANRLTPVETLIDPAVRCETDLDRAPSVKQALSALPRNQREVIVLRHIIGLSPRETADRMGRTESSIHGLHHRARRALRRELMQLGSAPVTRPTAG